MPARCRIYSHPERARIELAIARRVGYREIAKRFPDLHRDGISRHKRKHLPPQVEAALKVACRPADIDLEALRKSESEGLLQHLVAQRGRLYRLADLAEEVQDTKGAATVHGRIIDNLQLTAKLLGEITAGSQTTVNQLVISPEYLELRSRLVDALRPYPEARRAVGEVLSSLEGRQPHFTGVRRSQPLIEGKAA